jgi:HD superfamily phosphohydrolase
MTHNEPIHIRDPIHGTITLSAAELRLIDHPCFQRLRNIKQVGFAEYAFPGATHTRYSHSLGTLHLASQVFDRIVDAGRLPTDVRKQYRQLIRLGALLHDLGHAPLSHTTERLMPAVSTLKIPGVLEPNPNRRATHEDYTLKMILDSSLTESIQTLFGDFGVTPGLLAGLIDSRVSKASMSYDGVDYTPIFSQIISSECDVDRMDYLQRDSFFCGVNYGKFDAEWLLDNFVMVLKGNAAYLGIRSRAIFSFEDFLLSRYHMFASVYLHHTPVIFEKFLEKYIESSAAPFEIPSDIETYMRVDDVDLLHTLKHSKNPWARRIVLRQPFHLLDETKRDRHAGEYLQVDHDNLEQTLAKQGLEALRTRSSSTLSKYFGAQRHPIFVVTSAGKIGALEDYTPLFERYKESAQLHRIYVRPEDKHPARQCLASLVTQPDINA